MRSAAGARRPVSRKAASEYRERVGYPFRITYNLNAEKYGRFDRFAIWHVHAPSQADAWIRIAEILKDHFDTKTETRTVLNIEYVGP
jgi:hypothetical protein